MKIEITTDTQARINGLRYANVKIENKEYSFCSNDRLFIHFLRNLLNEVDLKVREAGE